MLDFIKVLHYKMRKVSQQFYERLHTLEYIFNCKKTIFCDLKIDKVWKYNLLLKVLKQNIYNKIH